jgi:hypothetical protein
MVQALIENNNLELLATQLVQAQELFGAQRS